MVKILRIESRPCTEMRCSVLLMMLCVEHLLPYMICIILMVEGGKYFTLSCGSSALDGCSILWMLWVFLCILAEWNYINLVMLRSELTVSSAVLIGMFSHLFSALFMWVIRSLFSSALECE